MKEYINNENYNMHGPKLSYRSDDNFSHNALQVYVLCMTLTSL